MKRTIDNELVLKAHVETPITASTAEVGKLLYPRNHEIYKAVVDVGVFDTTDLDETYNITLEVSDALNGTYNVMATLTDTIIKNGGNNYSYEIPLSGLWATYAKQDSLYIRVNATLGGTSPSLAYGCFLTQ